jgi:hypothetical protein
MKQLWLRCYGKSRRASAEPILFFFAALLLPWLAIADVPATEFFVIDTASLAKFAPTDEALDAIPSTQLSKVSVAHGLYIDSGRLIFSTETFRIDAEFSGSAYQPKGQATPINYRINASNNRTTWSVASLQGNATKLGNQFITENWRNQRLIVLFRFIDLKR